MYQDFFSSLYNGPLQMLPKFASDRTCLGTVLRIVLGLGSRPGLRALRLKLLYDLWLREDRVYAHLHKALEEEHSGVEYEVARARYVVQ